MILIKNLFLKRIYSLLAYDRPREALELIHRYSKLFSSDTSLGLALAHTFSQLDMEERFNQQVGLLEKYFEGTPHLHILRAMHLSRKHKYSEAINELLVAIEIDRKEPASFNNLGYYQSKVGLYKESIIHFDKAIEIDQKFYFAYDNRGYSRLMLGDPKSIDDIRYSLKKCPNNAVALKNLAKWEERFGDSRKVTSIITKAKSRKYYSQAKDELDEMELI